MSIPVAAVVRSKKDISPFCKTRGKIKQEAGQNKKQKNRKQEAEKQKRSGEGVVPLPQWRLKRKGRDSLERERKEE